MENLGTNPCVITTYAQVCVQCGKGTKDASLQRCGGCHRACYCGSKCYTEHWPKHKDVCEALKTLETQHGQELLKPFQLLDEFSGEPVGNADLANACISRVSEVEKRVLTEQLGRRPVFDEESLVNWQPRCLACGRSNLILRVEASSESKLALPTLKDCPDCHLSFACNDAHWNAVENSHKTLPCRNSVYDKSQCQINCAVLHDLLYLQTMVRDQARIGPLPKGPLRWAPRRTMAKWTPLKGADWSDYESRLTDEFGSHLAHDWRLKPLLRAQTEGLSMPLTMLWALEILNGEDISWTTKDVLNIHLLNATAKEASYADIFDEILNRLPEVKTLSLNFIGPELTVVAGTKLVTAPIETCFYCPRTGRKRLHQYHAQPYDEYVRTQGAGYTNPDLAVAFNLDSSQRALSVWKDTLKALMDRHVPSVFTAFTHDEAQAESRLLQATGAKLVPELGPRLNPWGSLLVKMSPNTINGFYASSEWLSGGFR